jgi:hypothetical protein
MQPLPSRCCGASPSEVPEQSVERLRLGDNDAIVFTLPRQRETLTWLRADLYLSRF